MTTEIQRLNDVQEFLLLGETFGWKPGENPKEFEVLEGGIKELIADRLRRTYPSPLPQGVNLDSKYGLTDAFFDDPEIGCNPLGWPIALLRAGIQAANVRERQRRGKEKVEVTRDTLEQVLPNILQVLIAQSEQIRQQIISRTDTEEFRKATSDPLWRDNWEKIAELAENAGWFCFRVVEDWQIGGLPVTELRSGSRIFQGIREHRIHEEKIHSVVKYLLVGPYIFRLEMQKQHNTYWFDEYGRFRCRAPLNDTNVWDLENVLGDERATITEKVNALVVQKRGQGPPNGFSIIVGRVDDGSENIKKHLEKVPPKTPERFYYSHLYLRGPYLLEGVDVNEFTEALKGAQAKAFELAILSYKAQLELNEKRRVVERISSGL